MNTITPIVHVRASTSGWEWHISYIDHYSEVRAHEGKGFENFLKALGNCLTKLQKIGVKECGIIHNSARWREIGLGKGRIKGDARKIYKNFAILADNYYYIYTNRHELDPRIR